MPGAPKPVLQKSVFQVKYKPELEFYRLLYTAAQKLEGFPQWQTDRLSVTLFNQQEHCSIGIAFDSFSFTQDSSNLEQESKYVHQTLQVLPSELHLENLTRFGLRRWYLVPMEDSFEALVQILALKLFSQDDELQKLLPKETKDLMYILVSSEGQYGFRIIIGPVRKFEIPNNIPFDREHHLDATKRRELESELTKQYPEVSVYLDIDMFQQADKLTQTDAASFYTEASKRVTKMASDMIDYLFRVKVEKK